MMKPKRNICRNKYSSWRLKVLSSTWRKKGFFAFLLTVFVTVTAAGQALAAPFGIPNLNQGYFQGVIDFDGANVLSGGIHSTSAAQFIADIQNYYNSGGANGTGASFIVNTMLGHNTP